MCTLAAPKALAPLIPAVAVEACLKVRRVVCWAEGTMDRLPLQQALKLGLSMRARSLHACACAE